MKDYYQILGVRRGAGLPEIRRAYRILVQKLHPDVNPDPQAHELIKEVNEAYDVLGDATKKIDYDYRLENPYIIAEEPKTPAHRDPAYKRRRTNVNTGGSAYTQRELMQQYLPHALWCCRLGLLFTMVLFLDGVLPTRTKVDKIEAIYKVKRGKYQSYSNDLIVTQSGLEIKLYDHDATYFVDKQNIKVTFTPMLSIPIQVSDEMDERSWRVGYIYQNMIFLPIVLFITSILGLILRKKTEFAFSLATISGILVVIVYSLMKP